MSKRKSSSVMGYGTRATRSLSSGTGNSRRAMDHGPAPPFSRVVASSCPRPTGASVSSNAPPAAPGAASSGASSSNKCRCAAVLRAFGGGFGTQVFVRHPGRPGARSERVWRYFLGRMAARVVTIRHAHRRPLRRCPGYHRRRAGPQGRGQRRGRQRGGRHGRRRRRTHRSPVPCPRAHRQSPRTPSSPCTRRAVRRPPSR